jgi:NitT/TauT family transport system permease protein
MSILSLRAPLTKKQHLTFGLAGGILIFAIWTVAVTIGGVRQSILPAPWKVVAALPELLIENHLLSHAFRSIWLNLLGYTEAIVIAIPVGYVMGLFTPIRSAFGGYVGASRYLPLSAVIGLFILWYGISTSMKVNFLALGILVYLLPVVIQRIDGVPQVYLDTLKTRGANRWQRIRYVFIPAAMSAISDDIRVLVAIGWTYIIMAEVINMQEGGLGALCNIAQRQSRTDKLFALILVIMLIGFIQDLIMVWIDRMAYKHKHV